jgi:polysaccharide export outer membrane protein
MRRTAVVVQMLILAAAFSPASASSSDAKYILGSGDKLKITVFGETDLSGEYEIDGSGGVAFPLIGTVPAAGGTARKLESRIIGKLKDGFLKNPTINIEVLTYRPFFILGEVKRPGSYPYKNGLTVLNAVAMAGGYTYRAKSSRWVVTRSGSKKYQDREIEQGDFRVLPGDTIVVPERFF